MGSLLIEVLWIVKKETVVRSTQNISGNRTGMNVSQQILLDIIAWKKTDKRKPYINITHDGSLNRSQ